MLEYSSLHISGCVEPAADVPRPNSAPVNEYQASTAKAATPMP
jgi:hypothetical protein